MSKIRPPKPKYFNNGVVEFYVKDKQIYYKVMLWVKDGLKQFEYVRGNYESDNQILTVIGGALQSSKDESRK